MKFVTQRRKDAKREVEIQDLLCVFAPLHETLLKEKRTHELAYGGPELSWPSSAQRVDQLPLHHAFIGPVDLNAQFLELAVKRGPRETKNLCAFLYVAAGA